MNAISRRALLRTLGLAGGSALTSGCTPMKILMHWYPPRFDTDRDLVDRTLNAFADAVLADAVEEGRFAVRPFHDERFPLPQVRGLSRIESLRPRERPLRDRSIRPPGAARALPTRTGLPPDAVAQAVLRALTARRPPIRIVVTGDRVKVGLARRLPTRLLDRLV